MEVFKMDVVAIKPRGYCYGVINALNVVKEATKNHPDKKIHILGIIIHNKFIKQALDNLGVVSIYDNSKSKMQLLDRINEGVVIFSAHGTAQDVLDKAIDKGLIVYNAVCRDVTKTQNIVKDYLSQDYQILYIGKENHPEAQAMLAIDNKICLITSVDDLGSIKISDKSMVTNQTTMSIYDTKEIIDKITELNNNVIVINEICNATKMRQEALLNLSDFDLLYVVGDHLSNNSNNLAKIGKNSVNKVKLIESVLDIEATDLINVKKVAVTSGASTPNSLTQQVITYLEKFPNVTSKDKEIDYAILL